MKIIERLKKLLGLKTSKQLDQQFKDAYQNVLFGQYRGLTLDAKEVQDDARLVIEKGEDAAWEDLYRLELDIVKLEPMASLRRRAWTLRNEFAEVATAEEVKDYYASQPPDPATAPEMDVRVDCVRLQEELNWRYIVLSTLEDFRSYQTYKVLTVSIYFLILALVAGPLLNAIPAIHMIMPPLNFTLLAMIVVPGILGGLVSTLRRIQATQFGGNADLVLMQFERGSSSIVLSPFFGGIFAFIFYCLVAGGFLTGTLFPNIGFENLLPETVSAPDFGEYAKLIIWSFLSGFSERLVPDQLEIFAKGVSSESGAGGGGATHGPAPRGKAPVKADPKAPVLDK